MIKLNFNKCIEVAKILKNITISIDYFTDPKLYPPVDTNYEDILNYFLAVIAIDHRTERTGKVNDKYEVVEEYCREISGEKFKGSDLLWRLSLLKFQENPKFFTPENLAKLREVEVRRWLDVKDVEVRTALLRDLGRKIMKYYNNSTLNLLDKIEKVCSDYQTSGVLEKLRIFKAYEDPVEKKSFLLIKFLKRRRLLKILDEENLHVCVDNHLTRVAIRLGLVEPSQELLPLLKWEREAEYFEDVVIRLTVRQAYKVVSNYSEVEPTILDDFFWNFGKKVCRLREAFCEECIFKSVCESMNEKLRKDLREHYYYKTWYY